MLVNFFRSQFDRFVNIIMIRIVFLILISNLDLVSSRRSDELTTYEISITKVNEIREKFGELFWSYVKFQKIKPPGVSSICYNDLKLVTSSKEERESWGYKSKANKIYS